jgi:hypothetical protein
MFDRFSLVVSFLKDLHSYFLNHPYSLRNFEITIILYAFVLYSLHFLFQTAVVWYTILIEFFFFDVCWMGYKWCWFIVDFWLVFEWLRSWFFLDQFRFEYITFSSTFMSNSPTIIKANDFKITSPLEYVLFLAWTLRQRTLLVYFCLTC